MAIINAAYKIFIAGNIVWAVMLVPLIISARYFPDHAGTVATAHLAVLAVTWLMVPVLALASAVEWFREWYGARRAGLSRSPPSLVDDEFPSRIVIESVQRVRSLAGLGGMLLGAGCAAFVLLSIQVGTAQTFTVTFGWIVGFCLGGLLSLGGSLCNRLANRRLAPFEKYMDQVAAKEVENRIRRLQADCALAAATTVPQAPADKDDF
jgi:hypothetical protein